MKLGKMRFPDGRETIAVAQDDAVIPLTLTGGLFQTLTDILESDDAAATVALLIDRTVAPTPISAVTPLSLVEAQEVWGAGVTYTRSRTARMQESATGATHYERVYAAPRPELFFKATPSRVVASGQQVRIRKDALWNVPEPELVLVLNSHMKLVGYTIGNDMSSRDIEGENPLYLPQAKVYDGSCALGPCVLLADTPLPKSTTIAVTITRKGGVIFTGSTSIAEIKREFNELVSYLFRDNTFPTGAYLMTGTGVVPEDDFTLEHGDVVTIVIEGIGTLSNTVT
jgi:2-dehydro-3-deoxy-D-arabinonate dehydratase